MRFQPIAIFAIACITLAGCQASETSRTSYPTTATPLTRTVTVTRHEDITPLVKASLSEDQSLYGVMAIRFHTDQSSKSGSRAPEQHVDMIIPMARRDGKFVSQPKEGVVYYLAGDDKTSHRQKHRLHDMSRNVERYFRSSPAAFVVRPWDGAKEYWGQQSEVDQMTAVFAYLSDLWPQPINLAGHSNGGALAVGLAQQLGDKIARVMVTEAVLDRKCHLENDGVASSDTTASTYDPSANLELLSNSTQIMVLHDPDDDRVAVECARPVAQEAAKRGLPVSFRSIEIRNDDDHHSNGPVNLGYEWGKWR